MNFSNPFFILFIGTAKNGHFLNTMKKFKKIRIGCRNLWQIKSNSTNN